MAIYVQIGKKDEIKGNVSAKGHENWIEVDSFQFGTARSIPMLVGKQTKREVSLPSFGEFSFTKAMDDSSPYLFQEATVGQSKTITVHVTKTGTTMAESVIEYILTAALLSSYSIAGSGDDLSEVITLSYTKVEMKYVLWDESHKKSSQIPVAYDLAVAAMG